MEQNIELTELDWDIYGYHNDGLNELCVFTLKLKKTAISEIQETTEQIFLDNERYGISKMIASRHGETFVTIF